jgi:hypothetical protein
MYINSSAAPPKREFLVASSAKIPRPGNTYFTSWLRNSDSLQTGQIPWLIGSNPSRINFPHQAQVTFIFLPSPRRYSPVCFPPKGPAKRDPGSPLFAFQKLLLLNPYRREDYRIFYNTIEIIRESKLSHPGMES